MGTTKEEEQEEEDISTVVTTLQNAVDPSTQHRWSEAETISLIKAYKERWYLLKKGQLKARHWEEVANKIFMSCGGSEPSKSSVQCQHKVEKLRKRYREEKQLEEERGIGYSSPWPYFGLMVDMEEGGQNRKRTLASTSPRNHPAGNRQVDKVAAGKNHPVEKISSYGNRQVDRSLVGNRHAEKIPAGSRPLHKSLGGNCQPAKTPSGNGRSQSTHGVQWKSEDCSTRGYHSTVRFKDDYEEEEEEEEEEQDDEDDADYDGRDTIRRPKRRNSRSTTSKGGATRARKTSSHRTPQPKVFKSNGQDDGYAGEENHGPVLFKSYDENNADNGEDNGRSQFFRSYGNDYAYDGEDTIEDGMFAERMNIELASVVRSIGEGFLRIEQMKLEMHRDNERLRAEVELKRTSMLLDSQKQISEMLTRALTGKKGVKKRQLQEL